MALKLAEEQARREEQEAREEEASNPMKLLENRTQQSRNEIEMLESLEELRDLNRRQQTVDYTSMLQQYNPAETERERQEREQREDEAFIKSVIFKSGSGARIVAEEIIEEVKDKPPAAKLIKSSSSIGFPALAASDSLVKRKTPLVLVKPKSALRTPSISASIPPAINESTPPTSKVPVGLALIADYSNSSEESD
ncbi:splicing factor YJU2 isoform X2 [Scaptodrosophila lebanonensis]|nr:splicing factor YJU2 isoform X2 [Scaptodrosophila lebanonensis]